jgi:hypothetical protein
MPDIFESRDQQEQYRRNLDATLTRAREAIRDAKALHSNLAKLNSHARKVAEAALGRQDTKGLSPDSRLDVLMTENEKVGRQLLRARARKMTKAEIRAHHRYLIEAFVLVEENAEHAAALATHWNERHSLLKKIAALFEK